MRVNGSSHFYKPRTVFSRFQNIRCGKILGRILRRVAERLNEPGMNQRRDVMRLAVEHPPGLFGIETDGQQPGHG